MIDTILTSRFIAFAPSNTGSKDSPVIRSLINVCRNQGLCILRQTPYFIALEVSESQREFGNENEYLVCDMLPGKLASQRRFNFRQDAVDWDNWHEVASDQAQLYNLLFSTASEFTFESDILGLKSLYVANVETGTLITSKIIDLFRLDENLIKPIDRMGLMQLILTGHPFGSRTIHDKVRRTKTGEKIHWNNISKELSVTRPRRLRISNDVQSDAGLIDSIQEIDNAISDSLGRRTSGASKPLNIGLSGGFDSRILAAVLNKRGESFNAFTYGLWHHREVRTAKQVAKVLDVNHTVLPYPLDNHYKRMELFLNTLEGQSDSNSVQIANLLQMDAPIGTPILHGFMSDAVAVTRFSDKKNGIVPKSLDQAAFNLASSMIKSDAHSKFLSNLLEFDVDIESICNELRNDMAPDGLAYHSAVLWDVENRQRRFISGHLPMLGQTFDVIAPFYDARLMSFWLSLPRISLDERYLQRQQLAKLYPDLAKIPHSEEIAPIIPNLTNQLRLLFDSTLRKLFITSYQKYAGYRTTNIWSLSGGMATKEQQTRMRNLFSDNLNDTDRILDLGTFKNDDVLSYFERGPANGDYITPRVIYQTSSYAKWLADSLR